MKETIKKVNNLIKWGMVTLCGKDTGNYPKSQISYMEKVKDIVLALPLGFAVNPPEETLVLLMNAQGQEENMTGMPLGTDERIKPLKKGEVAIYNPITQSYVVFREDKSILIDSKENLDVIVAGAVNITVTGNANIKAANVNIDASVTNLGVGGNAIARVGDSVKVPVPTHGDCIGEITSGGMNTSI